MNKKCLDLFSGTGSFSEAFKRSREWQVTEVDLNERDLDVISPDIQENILNLSAKNLPDADVVLASPPCKAFSLAAAHVHMTKDVKPKSEFGKESIKLVKKTIDLIDNIQPEFYFIENPRAGMRRLMRRKEWALGEPEGTVSWCQYGSNCMKPTDFWGRHPKSFKYRMCSNGESCHESASRGSRTGIQGIDTDVKRGAIPYALSLSILEAVERDIQFIKGTDECNVIRNNSNGIFDY